MLDSKPEAMPTEKVFLKYFENEAGERTPHYDVARYWIDCNKKVVAFVEDLDGKEKKTDLIYKMRISIPKAFVYAGDIRYDVLRKTTFDKVPKNPVFVIEDEANKYHGNFKTLEEARSLIESGRKVRGKFIESGCTVYTGYIKEVFTDAKMFVTDKGIRYFLST